MLCYRQQPSSTTSICCCILVGQQVAQQAVQHLVTWRCCWVLWFDNCLL